MKQPARHPDCHNDYVNGSVALLLTVQSLSAQADTVGAEFGWDGRRVRHLLDRYGSEIHTLMALCREQADLAEPLQHAPDYLRAEIAYGCTHEGALHLEDLLTHRTRLTYEIADSGLAALPEIADLAARGWAGTTSAATPRSGRTPSGSRPSGRRPSSRTTRVPPRPGQPRPRWSTSPSAELLELVETLVSTSSTDRPSSLDELDRPSTPGRRAAPARTRPTHPRRSGCAARRSRAGRPPCCAAPRARAGAAPTD